MKNVFKKEFENHLKSFNTWPYLFIGSGFSSRYIGTENWRDLLTNICQKINLPKNFHYYKSKSTKGLPEVATFMAEDLFNDWWNAAEFEDSREQFEKNSIDQESPFKYEVCKYLQHNDYEINPSYMQEYELIKKINVEGIITTNWDLLLEKTFNEFNTYIGQRKLIFNNSLDVGEIYKIHGCVSDPNSLVVTQKDYDLFHKNNPYLAAKLLTIFMEHPIIFLGYRIGDDNIHTILNSIITILDEENIGKLKDRLIFCERDENIEESQISDSYFFIGEKNINLPIKKIRYKSLNELYIVLSANSRRLPIKILRHMKHMVFDFVKSTKKKGKVFLADDTDLQSADYKNIEFVYGFGIKETLAKRGVRGIDARDLLIDVLLDNLNTEPLPICLEVLVDPKLKYVPYFKYLRKANLLDEKGLINENGQVESLSQEFIEKMNKITESDFYPTGAYLAKRKQINENYKTLQELLDAENYLHQVLYTPMLTIEKIDLELLFNFLKSKNPQKEDLKTEFRKLICFYDYLKYKLNQ